METKLTYENMYKMIHDYFQNFLGVTDMDSQGGKDSVHQFFSDELISRRRDWPIETNITEWLTSLVDNYPEHRYDVNIDPPYGYCCIDPESGNIVVQMREDVFDVIQKKNVKAIMNNSTFHCVIENGRVVVDREIIARFPCNFQIDELGREHPNTVDSWMFSDGGEGCPNTVV